MPSDNTCISALYVLPRSKRLTFKGHISEVQYFSGSFLQCLSPKQLVQIFHEKPQYVAQYSDLLLGNLSHLDLDDLLDLASVLDPSRPLMRGFIHRKMSSRRRTSSISSLTGSGEFGGDSSHMRVRKHAYFF